MKIYKKQKENGGGIYFPQGTDLSELFKRFCRDNIEPGLKIDF